MQKWVMIWLVLAGSLSCKKENNGGPVPPPPAQATFTNPLLNSGPDPWIIQKDTLYYYTHTLGNRIALWRTAKVSELKNVVPVTVWLAPATGANSQNVWAPELHYLDNKWYLYYTAGSGNLQTQRTFVLENSAADPLTGSWTDRGQLRDPNADLFAIDGTVLSHNGARYFLWSGQATAQDPTQRLYIAAMSNPWTLSGPRVEISAPQLGWERVGAPPAVNEGPQVLKNSQGRVFLVFSASGCWTDDYALGLLTLGNGGDPLNPADWTKSAQPVFSKKPSHAAYGPGHNAFFRSRDGTEDWIIYHANSSAGQGCSDLRSPRIQRFTWNADGAPVFGEPVSTGVPLNKPSGE